MLAHTITEMIIILSNQSDFQIIYLEIIMRVIMITIRT